MANYTYYGTATITASGFTTIFPFRFPYLLVNFLSTSDTLYLSTDGVTVPSTTPSDKVYAISPGQTIAIPNDLPLWFPSSSVIPKSVLLGNGINTGTPYETGNPYGGSLAGGLANPGTIINFIVSTGTHNFQVTGMG